MNHGFVDGNKRVGFAATYVFLRMSGMGIDATAAATTRFVLGNLRRGTFSKPQLESWLRKHTRPA